MGEDRKLSRSEVIRRLVELGLTVEMSIKQPSSLTTARAKELVIDPSAPPEERAQRRRRLQQGEGGCPRFSMPNPQIPLASMVKGILTSLYTEPEYCYSFGSVC